MYVCVCVCVCLRESASSDVRLFVALAEKKVRPVYNNAESIIYTRLAQKRYAGV